MKCRRSRGERLGWELSRPKREVNRKGRHLRRDEAMMDTAVGEVQGAGDVAD